MPKEIRIKVHFNQYNPGEIATFDDKAAADILDRRLGVELLRDKKGNIIDDPIPNAAEKPVGDPAPAFSAPAEGSTVADQPKPVAEVTAQSA